jgi:hypothetical protein
MHACHRQIKSAHAACWHGGATSPWLAIAEQACMQHALIHRVSHPSTRACLPCISPRGCEKDGERALPDSSFATRPWTE